MFDTTKQRAHLLFQCLKTLRLLRANRLRMDELGAALGVGYRTVQRMLRSIERAGIPVRRKMENRRLYVWVEREALIKALELDKPTALSRLPAARVLPARSPSPFDELNEWRETESI